jgi:serine/threonine-protein kinase
MSPEQAAGDREIDGRSDLYALGIVAYQMLTGQPPFTASSTPAMLVKHLSERPAPIEQRRGDVPPELARAVMTLLEKAPESRFPSAGALVKALDGGPMFSPAPQAGRPSSPGPAPDARPFAAAEPRVFGMELGLGAAVNKDLVAPSFGDRGSFTGQFPMPVSDEEMRRWNHPMVIDFRRKLAPYLYVNAAILAVNIVFNANMSWITVCWTIYMAWKYAKLWSNGLDWRDVFRQPREREIVDVVEDGVGYMRAMFNRDERARRREERRSQAQAMRASGALPMPGGLPPISPMAPLPASGYAARPMDPNAGVVRQAQMDRDDILRMLAQLNPADRAQVPDVGRSATALADKVQALSAMLANLDRDGGSQSAAALEAEITRLENDANPLDVQASETRVKRLALLKRQRRGLADVIERRRTVAGKLETCASALASMKLDLSRLVVGNQNVQNVTSLAMEAMSLAQSVDHVLSAADEVGRLTQRPARTP